MEIQEHNLFMPWLLFLIWLLLPSIENTSMLSSIFCMTLIALKKPSTDTDASMRGRKIIAEVSCKAYHVVRTKLNIFLKGFSEK